jgi:D-sedoheptulose 7-phosphate isomerase
VLIAISTSGRSPNVLRAVEAAKLCKVNTIALAGGDGGKLAQQADLALIVPSSDTARIQECHITLIHAICDIIDRHFTVSPK